MNTITIVAKVHEVKPLKQVGATNLCEFALKDSRKVKDGWETTWFNCKAWGKQAEFVSQYAKPEEVLIVTGTMESRKYEDKVYTEVNVSKVDFVPSSGKPASGTSKRGASTNDDYDPFGDE